MIITAQDYVASLVGTFALVIGGSTVATVASYRVAAERAKDAAQNGSSITIKKITSLSMAVEVLAQVVAHEAVIAALPF